MGTQSTQNKAVDCKRILLDKPPVLNQGQTLNPAWEASGDWPCHWIAPNEDIGECFVARFRCTFELTTPLHTHIHVTADERYCLYIDGQLVGRGPQRGIRSNWFYETYDLSLLPGVHQVSATLLHAGKFKPWAQVGVHPGFMLCPEDHKAIALMGTGVANWQVRLLPEYHMICGSEQLNKGFGGGPAFEIDALKQMSDDQADWLPARQLHQGSSGFWLYAQDPVHWLAPATLPAMLDQSIRHWIVRLAHDQDQSDCTLPVMQWLHGKPLHISAGCQLKIILDLEDYACYYPVITVSGGGRNGMVEMAYAESLFTSDPHGQIHKAHRDRVEGCQFHGLCDRLLPDGQMSRRLEPLWWRCGRYLQLMVKAGDEPLTLESLSLRQTRYPMDTKRAQAWACQGIEPLERLLPRCVRTLEVSTHETYTDCPYYEQLMYIGDTRVSALLTYVLTDDVRLPQLALKMFDLSRSNPTGLPTSNAPAQSGQIIPPFALWWICMIHDYAMWRGGRTFIRQLIPGARAVMDLFLACQDKTTGLIKSLPGWNYVDAVWPDGVTPGGRTGQISGIINWQVLLALKALVHLERWLDEPLLAKRNEQLADNLNTSLQRYCWDTQRGLYADDLKHECFSEHSQVLAILSGTLTGAEATELALKLNDDSNLVKTNLYFTHYWFTAMANTRQSQSWYQRLSLWYELLGRGYLTMPETQSMDTRSDCHPWSAHPAFHYVHSIVGIRPAAMAFTQVEICPMLGPLTAACAKVPHPSGDDIRVSWLRQGKQIQGTIQLPAGVSGFVNHHGQMIPLAMDAAAQSVTLTTYD